MSEIIFEIREDEIDGGYTASALGHGIHTEGDTIDEAVPITIYEKYLDWIGRGCFASGDPCRRY